MSRDEAESSRFPRCTVRHPGHGARCWLRPGHEGRHLIVKPGEVPSVETMNRVADARPDAPYKWVTMMVALEPIGRVGDALDYAAEGGNLTTLLGARGLIDRKRSVEDELLDRAIHAVKDRTGHDISRYMAREFIRAAEAMVRMGEYAAPKGEQ